MAGEETATPEPPAIRLEKLSEWASDAYGATKIGLGKGATYIGPAASAALSTAVSGTVQAATAVGSASLNLAKQINENPTFAQVIEKVASAGKAGISLAQQAYNSPVTSQVLNKGYEAGLYAVETASAVASTGMDIGKKIYEHPQTGQVLRFTDQAMGTIGTWVSSDPLIPAKVVCIVVPTLGSAATMKMCATAAASRAGKEALRAACIRSSLKAFNWLQLPASARATAVSAGVKANNGIVSGLIPGVFVVWMVYDGYRLARWGYDLYSEKYHLDSKL